MSTNEVPRCGVDTVAEIARLFQLNGDSQYGGEDVSQLEHGLQAAWLAEQEEAGSELIAAALLHDIGHLLHHLPDDAPDNGIDDLHEQLAFEWLESRFPPEVLEPVRLHVQAKRYLCTAEDGYWESLSAPSKQSLELQGGPMSDQECEDYRANPHFKASLRLRRWDDLAKIDNLETPPIEHFLDYVQQVVVDCEPQS
ncbi:phosphonate degradation HD-domain oxygenase [Aeoliella mucimassa]|uniref:HD domain-containing protein n=1 Tax=Aeoliella mucimassa TaxID=2527972 RepID=A0A518AVC3_9BACT|nr:phosphonate degradation HD-domain oxygenase [Aeoliella mucimassa]QDU58685.1 hypothetical protein Pan181_49250 [Aeoliella mucimassa]